MSRVIICDYGFLENVRRKPLVALATAFDLPLCAHSSPLHYVPTHPNRSPHPYIRAGAERTIHRRRGPALGGGGCRNF
eukprot:3078139-Prymnesium_polylepis.1